MHDAIRAAAGLLTDRNLEAGRGDRIALIDPGGEVHTFAAMHALCCRFAARLRDLGH